ncbi:hypothetical protein TNCV_1890411 [Trichonephila clavipes]|nr:hypothetical protein TNCV_1890411 [Trichonephila clavipes]
MASPQLPLVGLELVLSPTLNLKEHLSAWSDNFDAPEERSFSNGFHLIVTFMEINKPTSWSKRLRRCIYIAFQCFFEAPSDREKFRQKRISTLTDLAVGKSWSRLLDGQKCAQLFALSRVEGVAFFRIISRHDYLQAHLLKIGLADSAVCPLCKSRPVTGEHLSDCPTPLHKTTVEFPFLLERHLLNIGLQDALSLRGRRRA